MASITDSERPNSEIRRSELRRLRYELSVCIKQCERLAKSSPIDSERSVSPRSRVVGRARQLVRKLPGEFLGDVTLIEETAWASYLNGVSNIQSLVASLYRYDNALAANYGLGWFRRFRLYVIEFFAFSYVEVVEDDINHTSHSFEIPCRSLTQWFIMLISELVAVLTTIAVLAVIVGVIDGAPEFLRAFTQNLANESSETTRAVRGTLEFLQVFTQNLANAASATTGAGQVIGFLTLAKCFANIGITTLAANAALEIGLLIDEPGLRHVRRVLALSFTGMALYLIKEYPARHDAGEFLLGCLAGVIAGALWMLRSRSATETSRRYAWWRP